MGNPGRAGRFPKGQLESMPRGSQNPWGKNSLACSIQAEDRGLVYVHSADQLYLQREELRGAR